MKKILLTILTIIYFAASTGATIRFHYCMGEKAGWSLGGPGPKTCGICGMETSGEEDNGCCKDEHRHVKLQADQQVTESANMTMVLTGSPVILAASSEMPVTPVFNALKLLPATHAPPGIPPNRLYLLNRVFQI